MGTFEMIIVLLALTVLVSLAAIAIDWVGRPMRNRRFFPRMFRYADEIGTPAPVGPSPASAPIQPARRPQRQPQAEPPRPRTGRSPVPALAGAVRGVRARRPASTAAFSMSVEAARQERDQHQSLIATSATLSGPAEWHPGLTLDARVAGQKPTVEVKAERFWRATAARLGADSHFDAATRAAMAAGKAPQRRNPRTASTESMQLVGLRSASALADVRMHWPDDAVDPWSAA